MALAQISRKKEKVNPCPRCGAELLTIEGRITQWLTCPSCHFKTLVRKEKESVKFTPLK